MLAGAFHASAEILIYNQAYIETVIGDGRIRTNSYSGFVVWDTEGRMIRLDARTIRSALGKRKEYMVTEVFNYKVHYLSTGVAKEHFALSIPASEGAILLKGASSLVFTRNEDTRLAKK